MKVIPKFIGRPLLCFRVLPLFERQSVVVTATASDGDDDDDGEFYRLCGNCITHNFMYPEHHSFRCPIKNGDHDADVFYMLMKRKY
jgi:hypothetical protein